MRIILLAFLFALGTAGHGQGFSPVDRKKIRDEVTDSRSPNSYANLLRRYDSFDSTLTRNDFRLLYYGFVFQKNYMGYNDMKTGQIEKKMKAKNYEEALRICDSVLQEIPISLSANYQKEMCLYNQQAADSPWIKYRDRYDHLTDAILSSGDGVECETAFKTIFVSDEYEIIRRAFDVKRMSGQSLQEPCDLLRIQGTKKFDHSKIFFDTSETLNALEKSLKRN